MQLVCFMWKWCDKKLNTKKPRCFAIIELGESDKSQQDDQWVNDIRTISTGYEPVMITLRDKEFTPMSAFTDEEFENIIIEADKLYDNSDEG